LRTLGDIRELRDGIRWLVRLRMVAVVGVVVTTFVTSQFLQSAPGQARDICYTGLYGIAAFLFLYNVLFALMLRRLSGIWSARIIANLQIFLDFLSLTVLLHFAGGIENPFMYYYVFHTIVSAILLTRWEAAIQTFLAIAMFTALVLMEHYGVIRHWDLDLVPQLHFKAAPLYTFGKFFVLVSTLVLALYMTISVSERSRQKNVEISSIREQLTRRELPRSEEDVLREEKLSSLGKMSAGIAHEINNPLTVVLTNVEMAIEELKPDSSEREMLEIALEEILRCREIIEQLLTFSRTGDTGRKVCDAGQVFDESVTLIRNYANLNRVRVEANIPRGKVFCRINQNQLKQVLVNVMMNAIQAMPDGGRLNLDLSECAGQLIEFTVEDDGRGIPHSLLSKIFDPFFTTKRTGEGTGLGLSVCHRLIEIHHGVMNVESAEGQGTRVTVRLPCGS
jgi:signal transduction histidine kinase